MCQWPSVRNPINTLVWLYWTVARFCTVRSPVHGVANRGATSLVRAFASCEKNIEKHMQRRPGRGAHATRAATPLARAAASRRGSALNASHSTRSSPRLRASLPSATIATYRKSSWEHVPQAAGSRARKSRSSFRRPSAVVAAQACRTGESNTGCRRPRPWPESALVDSADAGATGAGGVGHTLLEGGGPASTPLHDRDAHVNSAELSAPILERPVCSHRAISHFWTCFPVLQPRNSGHTNAATRIEAV